MVASYIASFAHSYYVIYDSGKRCFELVIATRWHSGTMERMLDLSIERSQLRVLIVAKLHNNLRQVVHTYVQLSPSSMWSQGGDVPWLGR